MRFGIVLILIATLLIHGCTFLKYRPEKDDPFRTHPIGMRVYNESGTEFTEKDWGKYFTEISKGYENFRRCAGPLDKKVSYALDHIPIIIIPPKHDIPGESENSETYGYTLFDSSYMRKEHFTHGLVTHELIHEYLYLSGAYPMGDIFHSDELFMKCGWDYLSQEGDLTVTPPMRPAGSFGN